MSDEFYRASILSRWHISVIMTLQSFLKIFRTAGVWLSGGTFQNVDVIHNLANPAFAKFGASSGLRPPKPDAVLLRRAKAGTISGTLNRGNGSSSRILIKVYRNYGLSTKFILNGLRHRSQSLIKGKIRLIIL